MDGTGTLLATVTFTGETASGWQQANFATPVAITANTTYVVSYHAPNGHYTGDDAYFRAAGVDRPPLHALRDGVDGANGVYSLRRRRRRSRPTPSASRTTGSTSSSTPARRHHAADGHRPVPGAATRPA